MHKEVIKFLARRHWIFLKSTFADEHSYDALLVMFLSYLWAFVDSGFIDFVEVFDIYGEIVEEEDEDD